MENVSAHRLKELVSTGKDVIALFGMDGCGPCKVMKARMSGMNYGMPFVYVHAQTDQDAFLDWGIRTAPTVVAFQDGVIKAKLVGGQTTSNVLAFIDRAFS